MRTRLCRLIPIAMMTSLLPAAGPASAACSADLDGDGSVGFQDLTALLSSWGVCAGCPADLDGSGSVGFTDLTALLSGWGPCLDTGTFPASWISGGDCATEPDVQVHQYNENLYILRQSLCTNFEGPFIYLLFGQDRVLMQDTGAGGIDLRGVVDGVIDDWLVANGRSAIELVVTHSHGHGDHVAGDGQFANRPDTTVVGLSASSVATFFGMTDWPHSIVAYDLGGGRIVDVVAIPGHQSAHVAIYDRDTGIVLTGDTLYPGRCYISSFSQYVDSLERLVGFLKGKLVSWALGTHIEMTTTPGVDFAFGATNHPNEHPLELTRDHLIELRDAVVGMQGAPQIEVHDDFIVWPF